MLLRDTSFVVVDVETTGLSAANHRITEIALVHLAPAPKESMGWGMVESFQTLVNPEQYISPFITQHTGITNAMVYGKPTFQEIIPQIETFFAKSGASLFGGHNVNFDHGFLTQSLARVEFAASSFQPAPNGLICTCRLARRLLPQLRSKSLKSVQAYFGIRIRSSTEHLAMLKRLQRSSRILSRWPRKWRSRRSKIFSIAIY